MRPDGRSTEVDPDGRSTEVDPDDCSTEVSPEQRVLRMGQRCGLQKVLRNNANHARRYTASRGDTDRGGP